MAFEIKKGVLKKYTEESGVAEVVIPDEVTTVGAKAFDDYMQIKSIVFPAGLKNIKQYGINAGYADSMEKLVFLGTVEELSDNALYCSVQTIELPREKIVFEEKYSGYALTEICAYLMNAWSKEEKSFEELRAESRFGLSMAYLTSPEVFKEENRETVEAYIKKQKKKILAKIMETNYVAAVSSVLKMGLVTVKTIDEYIETASAANETEITAMLLDYKNQGISPKEKVKEENRREKNVWGPLTVTEAQKLWGFVKNEEGNGYILKTYKGTESDVEVPAVIGKLPVVRLATTFGTGSHSRYKTDERKHWFRENLKIVRIPSGVIEIDEYTFSELPSLEEIHMPDTVTKISNLAIGGYQFEETKACIYAPAGSYAEEFAKEKNIPFMVE